ncbi:MAG: hypothetical protein V3V40_06525 [Nitrosomonadaceae bacterium]
MPDTLKSRMMGLIALVITTTLCLLLVVYVGFAMYHKTPLGDDELKVFTAIAMGLANIVVMWFTAEITQRKP